MNYMFHTPGLNIIRHLIPVLCLLQVTLNAYAGNPKKPCEIALQADGLSRQRAWTLVDATPSDLASWAQRIPTHGTTTTQTNLDILRQHHRNYTKTVDSGPAGDQKDSGTCYLYAGSSMLQSVLIANKLVSSQFRISVTYLYFWSLIEQANSYLEKVIGALQTDVDLSSNKNEALLHLTDRIEDGGYGNWYLYLVAKYGIVPQEAMPPTKSTHDSELLLADTRSIVAATLMQMQQYLKDNLADHSHDKQSKQLSVLRRLKEEGLHALSTNLKSHLGLPPKSFLFDLAKYGPRPSENAFKKAWRRFTSTGTAQRMQGPYSPLEFLNLFPVINPSQFVAVEFVTGDAAVHVVRKHNMPGIAEPIAEIPLNQTRMMQTPISNLERIIIGSIANGYAIFTNLDFNTSVDEITGIIHPHVFNEAGNQQLPWQYALGVFWAAHAVIITGVDISNAHGSSEVVKFQIKNSHGTKWGDGGYGHLYKQAIFNVEDIIVHRSAMNADELHLWDHPELDEEEASRAD